MCGIAGIFLLDSANKYKLKTIEKMTENGVAMFRINLSHTALDVVEDTIEKIHSLGLMFPFVWIVRALRYEIKI